MKKIILILAVSVLVLASCALLTMFNPFKSGHIGVYTKSGDNASDFDFDSKGEVERTGDIGSDIDILLEPWVDLEGDPMPTIMLNIASPDSFSFILDLGIISLDDAAALEDSDLMPDSFAMDLSAKKDHCYYVISTPEKAEFFMLIDSVIIDGDASPYDADVYFTYIAR